MKWMRGTESFIPEESISTCIGQQQYTEGKAGAAQNPADSQPVLELLASAPANRRRLHARYTHVVSAACLFALHFPGGRDGRVADAGERQHVSRGLSLRRTQDVLCQRGRRSDDPLCVGIGGNPVHARKEKREASIKRTHTHRISAYIRLGCSCTMWGINR